MTWKSIFSGVAGPERTMYNPLFVKRAFSLSEDGRNFSTETYLEYQLNEKIGYERKQTFIFLSEKQNVGLFHSVRINLRHPRVFLYRWLKDPKT